MCNSIKNNLQEIVKKIKEAQELQEVIACLMMDLSSESEYIIKESSFVYDKEREEVRAIYRLYVNGRYASIEIDYCINTTLENSRIYYNYNTSYYSLNEFIKSF